MNKRLLTWFKVNRMSLILCLFSCTYLLINSLGFHVGMGPDSTNYLREANALLLGNGFNNHAVAGYDGFFGIWPIGYPILVAVLSFITRLEVYYASKLLMVIMMVATTLLFIKRFGKDAWIYLLFFCNPGYIEAMKYSSSEHIFYFAVLWFAFSSFDVWNQKDDEKENFKILMLAVSSLVAILTRWVGAYTLAIIGVLVILSFLGITMPKKQRKSLKLLMVFVFNSCVLLMYLAIVKINTGYATGMERPATNESLVQTLYTILKAENGEINNAFLQITYVDTLVALVLFVSLFIFFIVRLFKEKCEDKLPICFFFCGSVYWAGYIFTRLISYQDLDSRVLLPASLPWIVAVTYYLLRNQTVHGWIDNLVNCVWTRIMLVIVLFVLSFELHTNCSILGVPYNAYETLKSSVMDTYKDIPSGSLMITEDWCLQVFRMDLVRTCTFDSDSAQINQIIYEMHHDKYPHIYIQRSYLEYLFYLESINPYEDVASYQELKDIYFSDLSNIIKLK